MKKMRLHNNIFFLSLLTVAFTGCKKDFDNPNETPRDLVYTNPASAASAAVGLQRLYSIGQNSQGAPSGQASVIFSSVDANSLLTNETYLLNSGNIGEFQFDRGGSAVDGTNNVLINIWSTSNKIIFEANNVINYGLNSGDKPFASGLIAFATIHKAMALGTMANFWDHLPDTISSITTNNYTTFSPRIAGLKKVVAMLDFAINNVLTNAPDGKGISRLPTGDVDLLNTMYALKARYALIAGDYDAAIAAADKVDLKKKSIFTFISPSTNPVFESATGPNNIFQPVDSTFGLPKSIAPDFTDKRITFHARIETDATKPPRWRINGFYASNFTSVPYFLPGEMSLIKAEAYVRKAVPDLPTAIAELNKVRTKKPADDAFGLGADLPPYAGAVTADALLTDIYRNRCIELYMTGMKLEDMRRFNRLSAEDKNKRIYCPYPNREKDNNPNTPANPEL